MDVRVTPRHVLVPTLEGPWFLAGRDGWLSRIGRYRNALSAHLARAPITCERVSNSLSEWRALTSRPRSTRVCEICWSSTQAAFRTR